jgi:hypothetical protein
MRVRIAWPTITRNFAALLALAAVLSIAISAQNPGNALSKDKVLALNSAGVGDAVLIQQIERDGIRFEMNSDTTLELKAEGVSNKVLQALLNAASKPAVSSTSGSSNDPVPIMYKAGKFSELADYLRVSLRTSPNDYKSMALLTMTLLKMKEKDAAHAEFQQLAVHDQDPAAAPFVKQVRALFDTLEKTEEAKKQFSAALTELKADKATAAVDSFSASKLQTAILKAQIDNYAGEFDRATQRVTQISSPSSASERKLIESVRQQIEQNRQNFAVLMKKVDGIMYSDQGASYCNSFEFEKADAKYEIDPIFAPQLQQHFDNVRLLTQLAPLNPRVMDLAFHTALIVGSYDQLQQIGDRILDAKGSIRIPFMSYDRYFFVVVDAKSRHLRSEEDTHPFRVKYDYALHGIFGATAKDQQRARWYAKLEPFDLEFNQITGIAQKANDWRGGLQHESVALKLSPQGVAPLYTLMNIVHCRYGEAAQKTSTYNLGMYVLHVIGKENLKAGLLDPSKKTRDIWDADLMSAMANGYSAMAASRGDTLASANAAILTQAANSEQARSEEYAEAQQQGWSARLNVSAASLLDENAFEPIEALLGVL